MTLFNCVGFEMNRFIQKFLNLFSKVYRKTVGSESQNDLLIPNFQVDDDRHLWDSAWRNQPHRRIPSPLKLSQVLSLGQLEASYGQVILATISENPAEFSDQVWRETDNCPICGLETKIVDRVPASVHPEFQNGMNHFSFGVWMHQKCFETCSVIEGPAPVPW
ncbi:MAG: hypothetical protein JNM09_29035 [Blastocatellia bacterium]|nr:hypothetical protein [Blastocatellia bacterium]